MPIHTILGIKEVGTMGKRVTTIEFGYQEWLPGAGVS
jgi:hypothetical protein